MIVHITQKMYTKTMSMVDAMTGAFDVQMTEQHVANAVARHTQQQAQIVLDSYAREEAERAHREQHKPWQYMMDTFESTVGVLLWGLYCISMCCV